MNAPTEKEHSQTQRAPTLGGAPLQRVPESQSDHFWSDITKTLFGSFAGAGLAFLSNWWFQRRSQIRDNLAAGCRALFTIRSQLDDLANYRYGIRSGISVMYQANPGAPEWMFVKPVGFNFNESNVFDFKSLAFLLSTPTGRAAFERLQFTERTYLDLMARHSDFNNSAQEIQRAVSTVFRENGNATVEAMRGNLGPELIARVCDHQRAVVLRVDRDEQRYRNAFNLLNDVMSEMFGSKAKMSQVIIPEKFEQANLPALPTSLRDYVDSVPKDSD